MKPRRVLMIAHVFPPFFSIGGSIRVVKFIKYLTASADWLPSVLTIDDRQEYDTQRKEGSASLLKDIPQIVQVHRTNAGEPSVGLLEKGRAIRERNRLAARVINLLSSLRYWVKQHVLLPDENITWLPFGVRAGRRIIRREETDVIFVTCPPHSAALIGVLLKWLTRRPLVVDFRDDWVDTPWFHQKSALARQLERWQEQLVVRSADQLILVTAWSKTAFQQRYPRIPPQRFTLIPNGCDLADFANMPHMSAAPDALTIVHAGMLTSSDDWRRSPAGFFNALVRIKDTTPDLWERLCVIFTGKLPDTYRDLAAQQGLIDHIQEAGFVPWDDLLKLMTQADLLLTINYEGFATLIPGKIYEYWAVGGPPVLLLSCPGAAQQLIEENGLGWTADHYDADSIEATIRHVAAQKASRQPVRITRDGIERYDRARLANDLRAVFNTVAVAHQRQK
ncbi:MAG: glycosyltransferase [Chloroflexota bacterium]